MPGYARSLKKGDDANARRVIAGGTVANSAPTAGGQQMVACGLYSAIDAVAKCSGAGGSFDFRVWHYYADADVWALDDTLGTAGSVSVSTAGGLEIEAILNSPNFRCSTGIYIETTNYAGGGTADIWLIGRE